MVPLPPSAFVGCRGTALVCFIEQFNTSHTLANKHVACLNQPIMVPNQLWVSFEVKSDGERGLITQEAVWPILNTPPEIIARN
jgi:hypothetical protein